MREPARLRFEQRKHPMTIPISDPADPRIEAYRAVRERDLVGREHRFVAEGEVVLRCCSSNRVSTSNPFFSPRTGCRD